MINSHLKSARPVSVRSTRTTLDSVAIVGSTCPKCGIIKKSGKLSCCALGGAWFKQCGDDDGDAYLDHTWAEGIEACKSGW